MDTDQIFSYRDYRQFLSDWMKQKNLSYAEFCRKHRGFITLPSLKKLLACSRETFIRRGDYRISPQAWSGLLGAMRLPSRAIQHLLLLRLENDSAPERDAQGLVFRHALEGLLELNRRAFLQEAYQQRSRSLPNIESTSAYALGQLAENLPPPVRVKIMNDSLRHSKIHIIRQNDRPGLKRLKRLVVQLEKLVKAGAP